MFEGNNAVIAMQQRGGFDGDAAVSASLCLERSLLLPGKVCVTKDMDLSLLPWLEEVELAPAEIVRIPNKCMFTGILQDEVLFRKFKGWFSEGMRPMFFRPSSTEENFVKAMGLDWNDTASCDPALADLFGRKDYQRNLATRLGLEKSFPPFAIVEAPWKSGDVAAKLAEMRRKADTMGFRHVLVKRTDLDLGEGICRSDAPGFRKFLESQAGCNLILEVEIGPHESISNQWFLRDGQARYTGATRQIRDGFVHKGDIIASGDRMLPEDVVRRLRELTRPFVEHAANMGYGGVLGFDAVWNQERSLLYLTEANARVTAATYPYAVAQRLGYTEWAIANKVMMPAPWIEGIGSVKRELGDKLLFSPRRHHGIVPYMIGALSHPSMRRMGLLAIADDPRRAEQMLTEAVRRLTELHL